MPLFVLNACRTPLGALGGSLKALSAPALAGAALRGLLAGLDPALVEACILGQAIQAGSGPNPAREAARAAGLTRVPAITLNQGHASGLAAVLLAAQGDTDLAVAGGMESASDAPYLLPSARWGTRMGSAPVLDALLQDAHWPVPAQDASRARRAQEAGLFRQEITPLGTDRDDLPGSSGGPLPADGAAVVLLGSEAMASRRAPLARILAFAGGEGEPEAVRRVLLKAGLALGDIGLFELDGPGAFPELPAGAVNARGTAASLGLAPGAEGARKVVTLVHQQKHGNVRYGLAALESDGLGLALILELP